MKKLNIPKNLKIYSKKINLKFLKLVVKNNPAIIYLDMFILERLYHYPHFVILTKIDNKKATIFDPWSGEKIKIETKNLMRSISYVRNKLKISPKLIKIK